MDTDYVLAGDVGGTNLRIAAVSRDGSVLRQFTEPTPKDGTSVDLVEAVHRVAQQCIDTEPGSLTPAAFGLAIAALVNPIQGRILSSPNLPQLNGLVLADAISEKLQLKVVIENDATAAAIGEHWLGSSRGATTSVFVTLGTGVGGGLILDGQVFRGVDGTAGEVGHICVEPEGHPCGCGSRGCVEQYASATAIVRVATERLQDNSRSSLKDLTGFTSKDVYDAASSGDAVAAETFAVMGRYLGIALAGLVDVLNPELIVIGGGAAGSWDHFIDHLRSEIDARAFRHPAQRVHVVRASLGGKAGILGAARVALNSIEGQARMGSMA
jgi:glucokinase